MSIIFCYSSHTQFLYNMKLCIDEAMQLHLPHRCSSFASPQVYHITYLTKLCSFTFFPWEFTLSSRFMYSFVGCRLFPSTKFCKKKASQQLSLNLISMFQHQNSQISYQNKVFLVFLKVLIARYQVFLDNGLLTKRSNQYQPAKAGEGQGYGTM